MTGFSCRDSDVSVLIAAILLISDNVDIRLLVKTRRAAAQWARSSQGQTLAANIAAEVANVASAAAANVTKRVFTDDEKRQIREAIQAASSAAEVDKIERQLKVRRLPDMLLRSFTLFALYQSGTFKFATMVH